MDMILNCNIIIYLVVYFLSLLKKTVVRSIWEDLKNILLYLSNIIRVKTSMKKKFNKILVFHIHYEFDFKTHLKFCKFS